MSCGHPWLGQRLVVADGVVVSSAPADELDEHRVLDLVMQGAAHGAAGQGDAA